MGFISLGILAELSLEVLIIFTQDYANNKIKKH